MQGRRVRFGPTPEFDKIAVEAVGRDGTVLLHRSYYGLYPTDQWSIAHGHVEVPVRAYGLPVIVDEYHGARDYAGSYYDAGDEPGATPPRTEPHAFVRESGRTRLVGRGGVVAWNLGGAVATKVEINAAGEPAIWEDEKATHLRVLEDGRTYDLGIVSYVGHAAGDGFVLTQTEVLRPGVWVWQRGRLRPWGRLPEGWKPVATDGQGGLLAQNGSGLAILRGRSLHPIRLSSTVGWDELDWKNATFGRGGTFYVTAYRGTSADPYEATFTPR